MKLRFGTRKSRLAVIQTEIAADAVRRAFPEIEIEIVPMSTRGDRQLDRSLASFGGKGVFTRELEEALLAGTIDAAVHSAKDMPMELPGGLTIGAVLSREPAWDVLVTTSGVAAAQLPAGSVVGTSSLRRELQMKRLNPGVEVRLLRGNVQTRLQRLREGLYDGILLAGAGLKRLGIEPGDGLFMEELDTKWFVPAAGQGILALETQSGQWSQVMAAIHSPRDAFALRAEREFLTAVGGGCNAPCGAYCRIGENRLWMRVMHAADGAHPLYYTASLELKGAEGGSLPDPSYAVHLAALAYGGVARRRVSLVGAGPGDHGLLTQKGLDCIRRADAIVYDNLIASSILNEARLDAQLIYAGKRASNHAMRQEEINRLLARLAHEGNYVVRLKGGDPYIFGRGGEEAAYLQQEGIPFEIVPGVSSAYAVPAYAGIPVTCRHLSSSLHVVTGHEGEGGTGSGPDYGALAKSGGTKVFLMGFSRLEEITRRLMDCGEDKDTPAAVIQQGATSRQRTAVSTLEHIAETARQQGMSTPAILVVGPVVSLRGRLDWYGRGPLSRIRVLLTGTRSMVRRLEEALKPLGAETAALSLVEVCPADREADAQIYQRAGAYDWIVFTSANGVQRFFDRLIQAGTDYRKLSGVRLAAVGSGSARALRERGFFCDFTPFLSSGSGMAREWVPMLGQDERVLLVRARSGSPVLPDALKKRGIFYEELALYETWEDKRREEELNRQAREADYVVAASGSAARALFGMLEEPLRGKIKLVSIGPETTRAAQAAGLSVYRTAGEATAQGIAREILLDAQTNSKGDEECRLR